MIWAQKADFGGGDVSLAAGFVIGTKGYIGTGYKSSDSPPEKTFFYEYDPSSNLWSPKADLVGEARYSAVGFSIGNYGYICCGESQIGGAHLLNDLWQYDPSGDSWAQKADFGGIARSAAVGFVIGNYAYVGTGGGWGTGGLYDFWRYDPSGDNWLQIADFPGTRRSYAVAFNIGNYGYVATGWHQPNGVPRYPLKDLWQYDPSGDSWIQKTDFPGTARDGAVGFSDSTYGYVLLGVDSVTYPTDGYYYDPSLDSWTAMTDFSAGGRYTSVAFYLDGYGYVGTGYDAVVGASCDDFWRYEPVPTKGGSSALPLFSKILIG